VESACVWEIDQRAFAAVANDVVALVVVVNDVDEVGEENEVYGLGGVSEVFLVRRLVTFGGWSSAGFVLYSRYPTPQTFRGTTHAHRYRPRPRQHYHHHPLHHPNPT
jgi:hypothetical protein